MDKPIDEGKESSRPNGVRARVPTELSSVSWSRSCPGIPLEQLEPELPEIGFDLGKIAGELTVANPEVVAAARWGHELLRSVDSLSFATIEDLYRARRSALFPKAAARPGEYWGLLLLRATELSLKLPSGSKAKSTMSQGLKVIAQVWGAILSDVSGSLPPQQAQRSLAAIRGLLSGEAGKLHLPPAEQEMVDFANEVWVCLWQLLRLHPRVEELEPLLLQALSLIFDAYEYRLAIRFSDSLISDALYINVLSHRAQLVFMGLVDLLAAGTTANDEERESLRRALWFGQRMMTLSDEMGTYPHRLAQGDLSGEMVSAVLTMGVSSLARVEGALERPEIADRARLELHRRWVTAAKALQQMVSLLSWVDLNAYLQSLTRLRTLALLQV
ncbi:MAG: hypothetical protein FJ125_05115 [Deltaproteobacteria bacterium]|nr:hypothetical protein [Deltaproteobacteria bacterium]